MSVISATKRRNNPDMFAALRGWSPAPSGSAAAAQTQQQQQRTAAPLDTPREAESFRRAMEEARDRQQAPPSPPLTAVTRSVSYADHQHHHHQQQQQQYPPSPPFVQQQQQQQWAPSAAPAYAPPSPPFVMREPPAVKAWEQGQQQRQGRQRQTQPQQPQPQMPPPPAEVPAGVTAAPLDGAAHDRFDDMVYERFHDMRSAFLSMDADQSGRICAFSFYFRGIT